MSYTECCYWWHKRNVSLSSPQASIAKILQRSTLESWVHRYKCAVMCVRLPLLLHCSGQLKQGWMATSVHSIHHYPMCTHTTTSTNLHPSHSSLCFMPGHALCVCVCVCYSCWQCVCVCMCAVIWFRSKGPVGYLELIYAIMKWGRAPLRIVPIYRCGLLDWNIKWVKEIKIPQIRALSHSINQ